MYDLVDRPVASLADTDRFLLGAMRAWVHALTLSASPRGAIAARFSDGGEAFDAAMSLLNTGSTESLSFERPCHSCVEETEAVVLSLWRLVRAGRSSDATVMARVLVDHASARAMVAAIKRMPQRFEVSN